MSIKVALDTVFLRVDSASTREDRHTEVFATLLTDVRLRGVFIEEVLGMSVPLEVVEAMTVTTQYANRFAKGEPDISLRADGHVHVLVENKLGAGFSANQPVEYLLELLRWRKQIPNGLVKLVIQVPERRRASVERELRDRIGNARTAEDDLSSIEIEVVSWNQTLDALLPVELNDPAMEFVRDNLATMVRRDLAAVAQPLGTEHVRTLKDQTALEAVAAVEDLVRDLHERFTREGHAVAPDLALDYHGFLVGNGGAREMWIGASYRFGAQGGGGPLWLQLSGTEFTRDALALSGHDHPVFETAPDPTWVEGLVVSLPIVADLDPPTQVGRLYERILGLAELAVAVSNSRDASRPRV